MKFPEIRRGELTTLQVNIGYKCNQACVHCHVNASPIRTEMMSNETLLLILKVLKKYKIKTLDITGGAPEMHPGFKGLVIKAREIGVEVIDRCNLTILTEKGYEEMAEFLANNKVTVTASLPCYEKNNVDLQRGRGVYERSIEGLIKLNKLGYGIPDSDNGKVLNLVYNPLGASLPPEQIELEKSYRIALYEKYKITFNNLFTITNMPIQRFKMQLKRSNELEEYQKLLYDSYNSENIKSVMCRSLISVDWEGNIFDCDFNQQLGIKVKGNYKKLVDLINNQVNLSGNVIQVGSHCYGCTAGCGSSCGGALKS